MAFSGVLDAVAVNQKPGTPERQGPNHPSPVREKDAQIWQLVCLVVAG